MSGGPSTPLDQRADRGDPMPLVSIIVPTYRNPEPLQSTLAGLLEVDYPMDQYEIIVVDDGGDEATATAVDRCVEATEGVPAVRIHRQPNQGAAAARNQGARLARGEILVFVDDDMLVAPRFLHDHLSALAFFAPAAVCGFREFAPQLEKELARTPFGRFRLTAEPQQEWGPALEIYRSTAPDFPANCMEHPGGGLTANNLAVRRDDFFRIGGFDEQFPHAGYEDQEFAVRARAAGLQTLVCFANKAWHNDRRLSLREFCERQRRGALTAVLLAAKYPDRYSAADLFVRNSPVSRADSPGLVLIKTAKLLLATRVGTAVLFGFAYVAERLRAGPLVNRTYDALVGIFLFRGVREGWRRYGRGQAGEHTAVLIQ